MDTPHLAFGLVLTDAMFIEAAHMGQTQPEGLALATMGARVNSPWEHDFSRGYPIGAGCCRAAMRASDLGGLAAWEEPPTAGAIAGKLVHGGPMNRTACAVQCAALAGCTHFELNMHGGAARSNHGQCSVFASGGYSVTTACDASSERMICFQIAPTIPTVRSAKSYCAAAWSRAESSATGPTLGPEQANLLSAEELTPSCGLGLLCATEIGACAAEITRRSRPVVWALIIGAHGWAAGYYYAQATNKIVFSLPRNPDDDTLVAMSKVVLATPGGLVIPMYERQRKLLAAHFPSGHAAIAAPPVNIFGIFEGEITGKAQTHNWLRGHGLGEYSLAEHSSKELRLQLRNNPSAVPLPLVVKPSVGTAGRGVTIVRSAEELKVALSFPDKKALRFPGAWPPIVQEALETTDEYGVYFVAYGGVLLDAACLRFRFTSSLFVRQASWGTGLNDTRKVPCRDSPLPPSGLRRLVAATEYHGFGCLAVKARAPGRPGGPL